MPVSPELLATIKDKYREYRALNQQHGDMLRRIGAEERAAARLRLRRTDPETALDFRKKPEITDADRAYVAEHRERFHAARKGLEALEKDAYKPLAELVQQLPAGILEWTESIKGFGLGNLAAIIAESGDLTRYPNPGRLQSRMSLRVARDGRAVRPERGVNNHHNGQRLAVAYVVANCLIRANGRYAEIYRSRKTLEIEKAEMAGLKVVPQAQIPKGGREGLISQGQINYRAMRWMERRFLIDLWLAWHRAVGMEPPTSPHPNDAFAHVETMPRAKPEQPRPAAARKRGRPFGSKNRPKPAEPAPEIRVRQPPSPPRVDPQHVNGGDDEAYVTFGGMRFTP